MSAATRARLAALLGTPDPDLAELNLLVSAEAEPGLDVAAQLDRVERLAATAGERGDGAEGVLAVMRGTGLRGDIDDYDDPRNSFLDQVLDRRVGIPISLSALTIAVARRAGVPLVGIGMPGHFVVSDAGGPDARFWDPFGGWAELGLDDCARLVMRTAGVELEPSHLAPAAPREILVRMLANLRSSYARRGLLRDAFWTVELARIAMPDDESLAREHVALLTALGRYDEAEAVLEEFPGGDAARRAKELEVIRDLQRRRN